MGIIYHGSLSSTTYAEIYNRYRYPHIASFSKGISHRDVGIVNVTVNGIQVEDLVIDHMHW